jgi:hypothetical protein
LRPPALKRGNVYYMVPFREPAERTPIISSYEYAGTVDGKPHLRFFKAMGLSDANVFLEERQLSAIVDIDGLTRALKGNHAS